MRFTHRLAVVAALVAAPALLHAQVFRGRPNIPPPAPLPDRVATFIDTDNDDRSGPRLGVAYLTSGSVTAEKEGRRLSPMTSLFGWQFERQFPTGMKDAPLPMTELVLLAGGIEQNLFLPSASLVLGLRQPNGWEFGVGPTVTGAGAQLVVAGGITRPLGNLNIPMNLAVAPGRRGASISFTTGFNMK